MNYITVGGQEEEHQIKIDLSQGEFINAYYDEESSTIKISPLEENNKNILNQKGYWVSEPLTLNPFKKILNINLTAKNNSEKIESYFRFKKNDSKQWSEWLDFSELPVNFSYSNYIDFQFKIVLIAENKKSLSFLQDVSKNVLLNENLKFEKTKENNKETASIIPNMTSFSNNLGKAYANHYNGSDYAWKAFNNSNSISRNFWYSTKKDSYLEFTFQNPIFASGMILQTSYISGNLTGVKNFKVEGIDENGYKETLLEAVHPNTTEIKTYEFANINAFKTYRISGNSYYSDNYDYILISYFGLLPLLSDTLKTNNEYPLKSSKFSLQGKSLFAYSLPKDLLRIEQINGMFFSLSEIPPITSNTQHPYKIYSSPEYSSYFPAWKAFNQTNVDSVDCWVTPNGNKQGFLVLDTEQAGGLLFQEFSLTSRAGKMAAGEEIKHFTIQVSMNNKDFSTVFEAKNETGWGNNETRSYTLTKPVYCNQVKLNVLNNNGNGSYTTVANFDITPIKQEKEIAALVTDNKIIDLDDESLSPLSLEKLKEKSYMQFKRAKERKDINMSEFGNYFKSESLTLNKHFDINSIKLKKIIEKEEEDKSVKMDSI